LLLPHLPHSLNLKPSDFAAVPQTKSTKKGKKFEKFSAQQVSRLLKQCDHVTFRFKHAVSKFYDSPSETKTYLNVPVLTFHNNMLSDICRDKYIFTPSISYQIISELIEDSEERLGTYRLM
jgi:hypothetical protein